MRHGWKLARLGSGMQQVETFQHNFHHKFVIRSLKGRKQAEHVNEGTPARHGASGNNFNP